MVLETKKEFFLSYCDSRFSGLEEVSQVQAIPAFVRFDSLLRSSTSARGRCQEKGENLGLDQNDYELKLKIEKKVKLTNGDG